MFMKKNKLNLNFLIFIYALFITFITVLKYKQFFLQKHDIEYFRQRYEKSQYVLGEASPQKVDDALVYSYSGYIYVTSGDATTVNFETLPLGKFFCGLSYVIFHNFLYFNVIFYFAFVFGSGLILKHVLKNSFLIFVGMSFIGFMPFYQRLIRDCLLGLLLTTFAIWLMIVFFIENKNLKNQVMVKTILGSILTSFLIETKYVIPYFPIVFLMFLYFLYKNKSLRLKYIFIYLFIVIAIFFISYIGFFKTHDLFYFFKFHKYILSWYLNGKKSTNNLFVFTHFILFGFYDFKTLVIKVKEYTILWPIFYTIFTFYTVLFFIQKKFKDLEVAMYIWIIPLFISYNLGQAYGGRFVGHLMVFFIILSMRFFDEFITVLRSKKNETYKNT